MSEPVRSEALRRALAEEGDGLPTAFAARVASLAEARAARHFVWTDVALLGAFIAMIGVCVAGWFAFGAREAAGNAWLDVSWSDVAPAPWLLTGIVGVALVQLLAFRRRAMI
jgi:hypothetical protein